MTAYSIELLIIFALGLLMRKYKDNKLAKKSVCIFIAMSWIFISGLRHISIGPDTANYKRIFENALHIGWNDAIKNLFTVPLNFILKNITQSLNNMRDPGYVIFEKVFQIFSDNYQIYLVFVATIIVGTLMIWIYKYSNDIIVSSIIFFCLFFSFYCTTGIRQSLATIPVVFIGYKYIKEKKPVKFTLLCLLGSLLHRSALFMIPFYLFSKKQITWKYLLVVIFATPVIFLLKDTIVSSVASFTSYTDYLKYSGNANAWMFFSMMIMIFIVLMWKKDDIFEIRKDATFFYNAMIFALLCTPLVFANPNMMRVVQYFSLYLIILVPDIIKSFNPRERHIAYFVAMFVLIAMFLSSTQPYYFFWES